MLYVLTGTVQIGKTRWLERLVTKLAHEGITCYGVIAPGIWKEEPSPDGTGLTREKLGIENVLLPDNTRIPFALRRDIARAKGCYHPKSQAGAAQLGWHISDDAIEAVNRHMTSIASRSMRKEGPALLVIDELGRLELLSEQGLTEAISLLERGSVGSIRDALVVARDALAPLVEERFDAWGGCQLISPTKANEQLIIHALKAQKRP